MNDDDADDDADDDDVGCREFLARLDLSSITTLNNKLYNVWTTMNAQKGL